ncbi:MAG: NitT/TauT family transport system permease protein [Frankiaceae bacterium]|nr:NitT/TauT family transport system permease protein [Frankiaceae bacterium]
MTDAALETVVATALPNTAPGTPGRAPGWAARVRRAAMLVLAFVLLCGVWEFYKLVGSDQGTRILGARVLPRADDASMPHVLDVLRRFARPEQSTPGSKSVARVVLTACWFTFRLSIAGCALGAVVGLLLAMLMERSRLAERGLLPYVVLSQTVPLVALAPLVVGWGGRLHIGSAAWQPWMSVAVIASYLAFFPVAVGALRGLQSPTEASVELMRSYAASSWQTLWRLRLPAAVPYLVPALRLAGASSVVGAIVAEISTGTRGGIGRLIIQYAQQATGDPAKVYTAIIGAALLGLVVAGVVSLLDVALRAHQPRQVAAA